VSFIKDRKEASGLDLISCTLFGTFIAQHLNEERVAINSRVMYWRPE
jgi:hypothetical protein